MVTYPSTYGIFEEEIATICAIVHEHGGQVYLDGANLNAQVGLTPPGGRGRRRLPREPAQDLLHPARRRRPGHGPHRRGGSTWRSSCRGIPSFPVGGEQGIGAISAAPWGSASILLISWAYIAMMGPDGLKRASEIAILNANYVADRLHAHFPVVRTAASAGASRTSASSTRAASSAPPASRSTTSPSA